MIREATKAAIVVSKCQPESERTAQIRSNQADFAKIGRVADPVRKSVNIAKTCAPSMHRFTKRNMFGIIMPKLPLTD